MESPIQTTLSQYEDRIGGKFKPDKRFYGKVSINSKRFWQLVRGEKTLLVDEAARLSEFFDVPVTQLITNENPALYVNRMLGY